MAKSPDAFRTISEVSDALDTPAHVLRFWESKFSQIKPVKRAGARRYYRPQDVSLLAGIKTLLHEQGMTIKGAQKLLREKGVKHVQSIGENLATSEPQESPARDETVVEPKLEISNITAIRAGKPTEPAKSAPDLPENPVMDTSMPPRFFTGKAALNKDIVRANANKIAPLLARLKVVSAQMHRT